MKQFVITLLVAFGLIQPVWAEEKPNLDDATILAYVQCPDQDENCYFLTVDFNIYYIVKGKGYNKEEFIWLVDADAVFRNFKAAGALNRWQYVTLIWTKYSA